MSITRTAFCQEDKAMKRMVKLFVFLLLAAGFAGAQAAETVDLKLRFTAGTLFRARFATEESIKLTVFGENKDKSQTIGVTYAFEVKKADAAGLLISVVYEEIQFQETTENGKVDYDSTKPAAELPPLAAGVAQLVGKVFTVAVTPEGRITKIEGVGEMAKEAVAALARPKDMDNEDAKVSLSDAFGLTRVWQDMERIFSACPGKPVGIGDSWTRKEQVHNQLLLLCESTWTLSKRENGICILTTKGVIKENKDMSAKLRGVEEGTITIDGENGLVLSIELKQQVKGKGSLAGRELEGLGSFPITVTGNYKIETSKGSTPGKPAADKAPKKE